jgi:hypothetical protein
VGNHLENGQLGDEERDEIKTSCVSLGTGL